MHKNGHTHGYEWERCRGVKARIQELMRENERKSQMTREELMAFYAAVIRTPADQVPAGSPVIQAYEMTEHGHKIRIVDKAAVGQALAKMCDWNSADRIKLSTDDSLSAYLLELRAKPIGGTVLPFEHQPPGKCGEWRGEWRRDPSPRHRGGKMSAQAPAEFTREDALALLLRIATDGKNDMNDRLKPIRVHSRMCGYILTEGQVWTVIATLGKGGTER
jgi:hypothetical protein